MPVNKALHMLSPLISSAAKMAADSLIEQICQMWGMDENRKRLHRQLLAIQEKITDAEDRAVDSPVVNEWMKELDAVASEAMDVLDEFQYEALRQNAISQQPHCASAKVIEGFFTQENPIIFRYKMSNKLRKVLKKIDEIVTEMNKFNFARRDPATPIIDRETHSFVMESEVIGRDGEKENIISELLDPQRERYNISVLSIVGMGGLGKTTLAQLVYNDNRIKGHFQLLLWVCVSTEFKAANIIKSIIQVATKGGDVTTSNMEVLLNRLREILNRKRYLLVLDDVWNEQREKWNELRTMLFSEAGSGSVIIVTTRNQGVASIMETFSSHNLAKLTDEDSWRLFEKRAFGAWVEEPPEELCTIGRTIARKCYGLPLAVEAMGGLMRTKREVQDWRAIVESNIWDGLQSTGDVLPILKLSYHHLPPHIKQCFGFCAIFPQDYELERETLIQLWMANDFIPIPTNGSMENLENKGRFIFNELLLRSFFQNIREEDTDYGSIITCKMHDLMHDLATEIAGNKCAIIKGSIDLEIVQREIHYLCNTNTRGIELAGINNVLKKFPNVHTYLVHQGEYRTNHSSLLKSSSLRALKIYWERPPKELVYMKHIRYLDLSRVEARTLPETISTLYNLQTLKLSHSNIRELPTEMRYMINLRHLFLDGCSHLKRMPIGLGQLKYLRTLTKYVADLGRGGTIGELNNINLLSGHISLSGLECIRDSKDAQTVNLVAKTNLYSLNLEWGPTDNKKIIRNDQAVLEALTPHSDLKYLLIEGYRGSRFPTWMMEALIIRNLKRLRLKGCINCAELPPLWQLPLLEDLYLDRMESMTHIVGGTCNHVERSKSLIVFPALKVIEMMSLPNLESWHEEDSELIAFPKLNKLDIQYCPKLKSVPVHAPLLAIIKLDGCCEIKLQQISNLPMLSSLGVFVNEPPNVPDSFRPPKTLEEMKIRGFENVNPLEEEENQSCQINALRKLTITKSHCFFPCGPSKVLALGFWKYFAALESLWIRECNSLVFWPEEEFKSLKCLKELRIWECRNLTGTLQLSSLPTPCERGEDYLPRLESLDIRGCPELAEVPVCSKSLKKLLIWTCPKLAGEGLASLTNLTELKELWIDDCTNLIAWPDNMEHLPSLQELHIWSCPGIESFPQGLQQRLSSLQVLDVYDCPALERRCRIGGDYWHLVSPIPKKYCNIGSAVEISKWESFSRRLLICLPGMEDN